MRINLNELIKVKLTDLGKDIYYHRFDDVNRRVGRVYITPRFPDVDEDGYTSFQLWDFMNVYGKYMALASPNVIEPLEIVWEDET